MDQTVLMNAEINKRPKVRHVRNAAFKFHAFLKVDNLFDVFAELRRDKPVPGITAGTQ